MRTAKLRVRKMQLAVSGLYKDSFDPSAAFGEEEVFSKLKNWMSAKGFSDEDISDQLSRLRCCPVGERPPSPTELAEPGEEASDSEEVTPVPVPESSSRLVVADPAPLDIPAGSYLVSIQARTKFRRLHKIGECWRRPGVDFLLFEVLGQELPQPSQYNAVCHHCFNKGVINDDEASSGSSSSEVSGA